MKNSLFRFLLPVLCLAMILTLTACGKTASSDTGTVNTDSTDSSAVPDSGSYAYKSEFLDVKSDANWGLTPVVFTDDGFYATGNVVVGRQSVPEGTVEEYEGQYDIYSTMLYFVGPDGIAKPLPNYKPGMPAENTENLRDFNSYCSLGRPVPTAPTAMTRKCTSITRMNRATISSSSTPTERN